MHIPEVDRKKEREREREREFVCCIFDFREGVEKAFDRVNNGELGKC